MTVVMLVGGSEENYTLCGGLQSSPHCSGKKPSSTGLSSTVH